LFPTNISSNPVIVFFLKLNPLSGALELMRGLFVGYTINTETVILSLCTSITLFVIGVVYFRKTEGYFADLA
jgi:lipopolysaccharide transport system permease protein